VCNTRVHPGRAMAVLFVVYMPNEDRESTERDDQGSPASLRLHQVANVNNGEKSPGSDTDDVVAPKISIDLGDDDEFSAKKPLLGNGCSDLADNVGSTSGNKPDDDDTPPVRHQSLVTFDTDHSIPRRASENVLTKPENTKLIEGVSDSVVYKGDKVRFQITKLDAPDSESAKQPAAEPHASVVDLVAEATDEKKQESLLTDEQQPDIEMERLTLKEVSAQEYWWVDVLKNRTDIVIFLNNDTNTDSVF